MQGTSSDQSINQSQQNLHQIQTCSKASFELLQPIPIKWTAKLYNQGIKLQINKLRKSINVTLDNYDVIGQVGQTTNSVKSIEVINNPVMLFLRRARIITKELRFWIGQVPADCG